MNIGFNTVPLMCLVKMYSSYQMMLKIIFLDMHVSFLVQNDRGRSGLLQPLLWFIDFVG